MLTVSLVVEDELQEVTLRKILSEIRKDLYVANVFGKRGNLYIKDKIESFNRAAKYQPYIILTDLDQKDCPLALINQWINFTLSENLLFRVVVKEIESWIMADRTNFSSYLGVSEATLVRDIESISDPKRHLCYLAGKSRKRDIRKGLMPVGSAKQGPFHNMLLTEFIMNQWSIDNAKLHSPSLAKAVERIQHFSPTIEE